MKAEKASKLQRFLAIALTLVLLLQTAPAIAEGLIVYSEEITLSGEDWTPGKSGAIDITANVIWHTDGDKWKPPSQVTLNLLADGFPYEGENASVQVSAGDGWTHTWLDLPVYRAGAGEGQEQEIAYTVTQDAVSDFYTMYQVNAEMRALEIINIRMDGSLKLNMASGSMFRIRFDGDLSMTAVVTFEPYIAGQPENLRIILPPFFGLTALPRAGDGYQVDVRDVPLPKEFYPMAAADILKSFPADKTMCQQVLISFDETVDSEFILTLGMKTTNYKDLGELMTLYGTQPGAIPLKIVAMAEDVKGNRLGYAELLSDSTMTNASGTMPYESRFTYPNLNVNGAITHRTEGTDHCGYEVRTLQLYAKARNFFLARLEPWHYPYTDVVFYVPCPEPLAVTGFLNVAYTPGPDDYVTLFGKRYLRIPYAQLGTINTASNFPASATYSDHYYMVTYMFPPLDEVRPGDPYEFGDVYISYTHKGISYGADGDEDPIRIWTIDDYTITSNRRNLSTAYFFWDKNIGSGSYGNNSNLIRRLQGLDGDRYRVVLHNSFWTQLSYTYEEADVAIDFPYELMPTAISFEATNLLSNSFQSNQPQASEKMYPTSMTYWVRGTAQPQTIALGQTQTSASFPVGAHVSRVSFRYAEIPPYMRTMSFDITANNASTRQDGTQLPSEYGLFLNTTVTTASGMRVTAAKDPTRRTEEWFNYSASQYFYLVRPTDSLRFGVLNYYGNTATTVNNRGQAGIANAPSPNYYYNNQNAPEPVTSPMTDPFPWAFALMKTDGQMQDYEDVVITITAPSNGKAMEKLRGFDIGYNLHTISSQLTVEYTTNHGNRSHALRAATNSQNRAFLNLAAGEHVLADSEVRIRFGTLYGDKMSPFGWTFQNVPSELDTTIGRWNVGQWWWNQYHIAPFFSGAHRHADGTPLNPVDQMVATLTTSTEAQYINQVPGKSPVFNNKAVGTIHNVTRWTSNVHVRKPAESRDWNVPTKAFYPNTDVSFDLRFFTLGLLDNDRQGEIIDSLNQYKQFDFGGTLLYMEVAAGFSLSGVDGYTIQEIRDIPGSRNKLYIFAANSFDAPLRIWSSDQYNNNNHLNFFHRVDVYAQPDAALSTELTPIIVSAGLSMDAFAAKYMTPPDGENAYYNAPPFHIINFVGDPFPSRWGVEDAAIQIAIPDIDVATSVTVQMASLDRVAIRPGASGLISSVNSLPFYDYQGETLTAKAWMQNSTDRTIGLYEAVFQLPRLDMPTLGSGTTSKQMFSNDYPLYLRAPVQYDPGIVKEIIYYDGFEGTGNRVDITASSSREALRSVQSFVVVIEGLEANRAGIVDIPLYTDHEKRGPDTRELKAYVGVKRRYQADPSVRMSTYAYSSPAEYVYMSRNLQMNIFLDTTETGSALNHGQYNQNSDAYPVVYYMGTDGVERVLFNGQNQWRSQYNVLVNSDVTRVEMHNRRPEMYGYTLMKAPGVGEMYNSDFPRNDPDKPVELRVEYDDLRGVNNANRRYDLGLFVLPFAQSQDVFVRVNDSKPVALHVQHPWQYINNIEEKRFTSFDLDYEGHDAEIAALTETGWVTGKQVGSTGYSATVGNTFSLTDQALPSDTVPVSGNIYVMESFRVALRMYFDNDYDSRFSEGDEPVLFPDWQTASQYLWLGDEWKNNQPQIENPHYDEETGYLSFELLDPSSHFVCALSPFPYDLATAGSANFSRISPIGDQQNPNKGEYWSMIRYASEGNQLIARMRQDFSAMSASFEDGAVTVSIDFALQRPITFTFRARNGQIVEGRSPDSGSGSIVTVDGSAVQHDAEGAFVQYKRWHSDWMNLFSNYAGVEPDEGFVWPELMYDWGVDDWGTGDIRSWAYVNDGQEEVRTETQWNNYFYDNKMSGNMTFWALPFRPVYLNVLTFEDTNGNNVYDEGEAILAYPLMDNSELRWAGGQYDEATGYWRYLVEPGAMNFLFAPLTGFMMPPFERHYHGEQYALRYDGQTTMHDMPHQMLIAMLELGAVPVADFSLDLSEMAPETDVYLEIPMRKPHVVTFKTEHGSIAPSPMGWELLMRFLNPMDPVRIDENGHPYMQIDYYDSNWLTLGVTDENLYMNPELGMSEEDIAAMMAMYEAEIYPMDTFDLFVEVSAGLGYLWPSNPDQRLWKCLETGETRSETNWRQYKVTQDLTFVAQPRRIFYTVHYLPNGEGIAGETDDGQVYFKNDTAEIIGHHFTLPVFPGTTDPYFEFVGWNTRPDGSGVAYAPYESTFTFDEDDLTLYAQWRALYRVEHHLQSDYDPQVFDLVTADLVVAYQEPGRQVSAQPRAYPGYRYIAALSNTSGEVMMPTASSEGLEGMEILRLVMYYERLPELGIAKTAGNANPRMGEAVTYRLTVTNNGAGPARDVAVADALPQGVTYISAIPELESDGDAAWDGSEVTWSIPVIMPGASATLNVLVRVDAEVGTRIVNTATITGEFGKAFDDPVEDDEEIVVSEPLFIVTKEVDKSEAYLGEAVQYTISVTNASADATDIVVSDQVPSALVDLTADPQNQVSMQGNDILWTIPALSNGESATLTIMGTISGSTDATAIANVAQIVSEGGAGFDENNRPTSQPAGTKILRPALDIAKKASASEARTGETVTFSVVVSNAGSGAAEDVVVIDTLPEGLRYVSAEALDGTIASEDGTITWTIAYLAADADAEMIVKAQVVAASGTVTNSAAIQSENGVGFEHPTTDTADVEVKNPSLTIAKEADVSEAYAGDTVTYTIAVENTGGAPAVDIVVSDMLPDGLKYVGCEASSGNAMHIPADGLFLTRDQVIWTIPALDVGERAQLEITAEIDAKAGVITNTAVLKSENGFDITDDADSADVEVLPTPTYTLMYDPNGGTLGVGAISKETDIPKDTPVAQTASYAANTGMGAPVWLGYDFVGWFTEPNGGAEVTATTMVSDVDDLTLYAQWTAKDNITVTFDKNTADAVTGPSPADKTVTFDAAYGALPTISRTGYTFDGWFTASTGGTEVTEETVVSNASDHILYAQWTADAATVRFYNNHSAIDDARYAAGEEANAESKFGDTLSAFADPERTGYTFAGWFTARSGGRSWDFANDTIATAGTLDLYAQWTADNVTVNFFNNHADDDDSRHAAGDTANAGKRFADTLAAFTDPARAGYTFQGWYAERSGGTQYIPGSSMIDVAGTLNLYAQWTADAVTVNFFNNHSATDDTSYAVGDAANTGKKFGDALNTFADPERMGYTFAGWFTARAGDTNWDFANDAIATEGTLDLYAQWTADAVTVNFFNNHSATDDTGYAVGEAANAGKKFDDTLDTFADPERTGYTFQGWYSARTDGAQWDFATDTIATEGSLDLYAQWTADAVAVNFYNNHAATDDTRYAAGETANADAKFGETLSAFADPERTGYTFAGWYTARTDGTQWDFATDTIATEGTLDLYAQWTADAVAVSFFNNHSDADDSRDTAGEAANTGKAFGDKLTEAADPSRQGYTFNGWYTARSGGRLWDFDNDAVDTEGSLNLYAQWTRNVIAITYDANDTAEHPASAFTPATGSDAAPAFGKIGEGATGAPAYVDPGAPTRTGHTFAGWYASLGAAAAKAPGTAWVFDTDTVAMHEGSMTLYAGWISNTNDITYGYTGAVPAGADAALPSEEIDVPYNAARTVAQAPTLYGYTFSGWDTGDVAVDAGGNFNMPDGSVTFTGSWAAKDVAVHTNLNHTATDTTPYQAGNDANADKKFGDTLANFADPQREGYTFDGWYTGRTGGTKYTPGISAIDTEGPLELYAQWTLNSRNLTYRYTNTPAGAPAVPAVESVPFGTSKAVWQPGEITGYAFSGWTASGTSATSGNFTMPDNAVTFTGTWTAKPVTISFFNNHDASDTSRYTAGEGVNAGKRFGDTLANFTAPARTGHTFDGWFTASGKQYVPGTSAIDTEGPLELYAKWSPKQIQVRFFNNYGGADATRYAAGEAANTGKLYGDTLSAFADPAREQHDFVGWFTARAGGTQYVPGVSAIDTDSTLNLYAQWISNHVTIRYTTGNPGMGAASSASETIHKALGTAQGSTATAQPGFLFVNWTDGQGRAVSTSATFVPAKVAGENVEATYTANFREMDPVTIFYVAREGGSVFPAASRVNPVTGEPARSTATPAPGSVFVNWTDAQGNVVSTSITYRPRKAEGEQWRNGATYYANFAPSSSGEVMNIPVTKVWNVPAGVTRLPAVTIILQRDGRPYRTVQLSGGNWTGSFDGVPRTAPDGRAYVYTVSENAVPGFTVTGVTGSAEAGFTITSTARDLTVSFVDWNGRLIKQETVPYGGSAAPPDDPTRDRHEFLTWTGRYENVTRNEYVYAKYRRTGDGTFTILDAAVPLAGGAVSNFGDCVE